jgi:hypothetical protein
MLWHYRRLLHNRAESPEAAPGDAQHKPVFGHRGERGGPSGPVGVARRHTAEVTAQQRDGKLVKCV